jgi:hypothetical protein
MQPLETRNAAVCFAEPAAFEQFGQFAFVADDFRDVRQSGYFFGRPSGVAAQYDDLRAGMFLCQAANDFAAFGLALRRDRAGVDQDQIEGLVPAVENFPIS